MGKAMIDEGRIYCRRCSYDLRGQVEPRCPECGRGFDPGDPRTFRRRPRRAWVRPVVRIAIVLLLLAASPFAWLYYDWRREQAAVKHFTGLRASVKVSRMDVPVLSRLLPDRYGWILERVTEIGQFNQGSPDDLRLAATCRRVEELDLSESPVTRDGLESIAGLRNLRALYLVGMAIDDAAARRLGRMRSLRWLGIGGTSITDAGLAQLCGLPEIEVLIFQSPHVTAAGLDALAVLPKLQKLGLFGPALEDDALARLARLTHLQRLYLYCGRFTPAAVQRLKAALPKCDVQVDPDCIIPDTPATNPATAPAP